MPGASSGRSRFRAPLFIFDGPHPRLSARPAVRCAARRAEATHAPLSSSLPPFARRVAPASLPSAALVAPPTTGRGRLLFALADIGPFPVSERTVPRLPVSAVRLRPPRLAASFLHPRRLALPLLCASRPAPSSCPLSLRALRRARVTLPASDVPSRASVRPASERPGGALGAEARAAGRSLRRPRVAGGERVASPARLPCGGARAGAAPGGGERRRSPPPTPLGSRRLATAPAVGRGSELARVPRGRWPQPDRAPRAPVDRARARSRGARLGRSWCAARGTTSPTWTRSTSRCAGRIFRAARASRDPDSKNAPPRSGKGQKGGAWCRGARGNACGGVRNARRAASGGARGARGVASGRGGTAARAARPASRLRAFARFERGAWRGVASPPPFPPRVGPSHRLPP